MSKNNSNRNAYVLPMNARCKSEKFHDRREERGGSKNKQTDLLLEWNEATDGYAE
jgi:hypothetical protein